MNEVLDSSGWVGGWVGGRNVPGQRGSRRRGPWVGREEGQGHAFMRGWVGGWMEEKEGVGGWVGRTRSTKKPAKRAMGRERGGTRARATASLRVATATT